MGPNSHRSSPTKVLEVRPGSAPGTAHTCRLPDLGAAETPGRAGWGKRNLPGGCASRPHPTPARLPQQLTPGPLPPGPKAAPRLRSSGSPAPALTHPAPFLPSQPLPAFLPTPQHPLYWTPVLLDAS